MRILIPWAFLLLVVPASILGAQEPLVPETVATGNRLAGSWIVNDGSMLIVQDGRSLVFLENTPVVTVRSLMVLPDDCYLWCWVAPEKDGAGSIWLQRTGSVESAVIGDEPVVRTFTRRSEGGDVFRGRLSAPPVMRRFAWRSGQTRLWIVPTLSGLRFFRSEGEKAPDDLGLEAARFTSEQSLGYGIGYRMKARVTVPFFDLDAGSLPPRFLFRQTTAYATRPVSGGKASAWGKAPDEDNNEVVKFDHRVPPLSEDYDGDGLKDLIHVDPGSGTILVYRAKGRKDGASAEPDRVFRITGHVLWRWLADGDGDGRKDLFLLELSRLNVLAQVNVMQKRTLPVALSMRRQKEDGKFQASARWSDRFHLPCEISMTRAVNRVRFRAPLKLLPSAGKPLRILAPSKEGGTVIYDRKDNAWEEVAGVSGLVLDQGFHIEPFATHLWPSPSGDSLVMLLRNPGSEKDRVLRVPVPAR